jgi:hypothetical protein
MLEQVKSPAALARGRAENESVFSKLKNSKAIDRLQARTNELEAMAVWNEELQAKIRRAHLIIEFVDCFHHDESLAAEVEMFKEVCARLAVSRREPLPERRAA